MIAGAVLSDDLLYRYSLWRHWGDGADRLTYVMLNPSTADADVDDPTIRRCIGFAKREGFDGIEVLNLFAWRATSPQELMIVIRNDAVEARGRENTWHWDRVLSASSLVVAAWGATFVPSFAQLRSLTNFTELGGRVVCLGTTKSGSPRHPLYVKGDQPLIDFNHIDNNGSTP